jgi:hypothetical protein
MGTWICHLRIAERLLVELPDLDEAAFTFGNIAPDSGVPNESWTVFDPPKEVTHFLRKGEGEHAIRDLEFYRAYLIDPFVSADTARYSFLLGYFFHLLADNLWALRIWRPSKLYFDELVSAKGELAASWDFKSDWYDLDHRYVRDHPDSLFWRVFLRAPLPAPYLPYLPETAIAQHIEYIRKFYGDPAERALDRAYPFLNEATMARFVDDTTASILRLRRLLAAREASDGYPSAVALLPAEEKSPFPVPLGDNSQPM